MAKRQRLAECSEIPLGKSKVVYLDDEREIALFHLAEGSFYALNNLCPHREGPLGEGKLDGAIITCPWHGWEFDVRTGESTNMAGECTETIAIEVDGGTIYLSE